MIFDRRRFCQQRMAAQPSHNLTIQAIADSIGIIINDPAMEALLQQEAENYVKKILYGADSIAQAARAFSLSGDHISMFLEAMRLPPLYGYQSTPTYLSSSIPVDNADLVPLKDPIVDLKELIEHPLAPKPINTNHNLHWTLIDGVFAERKSSSSKKSQNKQNKVVIERSGSVPNVSQMQHSDSNRYNDAPVEKSSEPHRFADDMLGAEYQKYFINTMNLLRCDSVNSHEIIYELISTETKLQTLLPYFIQYIMGKIVVDKNRSKEMLMLARFCYALVRNKSLNIGLFVHSLLKIAFTFTIAYEIDDLAHNYEVRKQGGQIIKIIIDRCQYQFPNIRTSIANTLFSTLFNPSSTLAAHYGALYTIGLLGNDIISTIVPHITSYIKYVKKEEYLGDFRQTNASEQVTYLAKELIYQMISETTDEQMMEKLKNSIKTIEEPDEDW